MKKYLLHFCLLAFALLSLCGCDNLKYAELYEITDEFVEELHTNVEEYEALRAALESHYADDERVTEVYRCRAGTIMINCRH